MKRTYVDSSVLISAARGTAEVSARSLTILDDPEREFVTSIFLELELVPKAAYNGSDAEVGFYEAFFQACSKRVKGSRSLLRRAYKEAVTCGLSAMDALHVVSAVKGKANELVTLEGPTKPMHRTSLVRIVRLMP